MHVIIELNNVQQRQSNNEIKLPTIYENPEISQEEIEQVNGLPSENSGEYDLSDNITITGNNISSIETNNKDVIKISKNYKKSLLKRKFYYHISFLQRKSAYINIHFTNKTSRMYGIYIKNSIFKKVKLGSLSDDLENELGYWKDDTYSKKYIEAFYYNIKQGTEIIDIINYIKTCSKLGAECKFVYNVFYNDKGVDKDNYNEAKQKYENGEYMEKYISYFMNLLKTIKTYSKLHQNVSIIYEPYLLTNIYEYHRSAKFNPKKVYISNGKQYSNIVEYIKYINSLCKLSDIDVVNVFNNELIINVINGVSKKDMVENIQDIKKHAVSISNYYSYFINENTKYIAFDKYYIDGALVNNCDWLWNNDEWINCLFFIKTFLEEIKNRLSEKFSFNSQKIYGILYDIPVGHMNRSIDKSDYTNKVFEDHTNTNCDGEDSSSVFLFGGCFKPNHSKFYENNWKDTGLRTDKYLVCYNEHLSLCYEFGIRYVLFGPGSKISSSHIPLRDKGNKITDHNYTISKIQDFYKNN